MENLKNAQTESTPQQHQQFLQSVILSQTKLSGGKKFIARTATSQDKEEISYIFRSPDRALGPKRVNSAVDESINHSLSVVGEVEIPHQALLPRQVKQRYHIIFKKELTTFETGTINDLRIVSFMAVQPIENRSKLINNRNNFESDGTGLIRFSIGSIDNSNALLLVLTQVDPNYNKEEIIEATRTALLKEIFKRKTGSIVFSMNSTSSTSDHSSYKASMSKSGFIELYDLLNNNHTPHTGEGSTEYETRMIAQAKGFDKIPSQLQATAREGLLSLLSIQAEVRGTEYSFPPHRTIMVGWKESFEASQKKIELAGARK